MATYSSNTTLKYNGGIYAFAGAVGNGFVSLYSGPSSGYADVTIITKADVLLNGHFAYSGLDTNGFGGSGVISQLRIGAGTTVQVVWSGAGTVPATLIGVHFVNTP